MYFNGALQSFIQTGGRHRTPSTSNRYGLSSDFHNYSQSYSDTSPTLYRSNHGYTDNSRESYFSYPNLSNRGLSSSDGGSMSKYTRNYDVSTRSYDSPRLHERGRLDLDEAADASSFQPFEFGTCYTKSSRSHDSQATAKSHDITTKSHDIRSGSYDRSTRSNDVTRQSPARSSSSEPEEIESDILSDRAHGRPGQGVDGAAPLDPVPAGPLPPSGRQRQRLDSGDSTSSYASEKSGHGDERSLFNALKHRYQETAERQSGDPSRTPFSSWRRSGNFEDVTSSPLRRERNESREKSYTTDEERLNETRSDGNADELISNFRTALRRHVLSESEKEGEGKTPSEENGEETAAQKLERLRAARAKIHERRMQEKAKSESFATEYTPKVDQQRPASAKLTEDGSVTPVQKTHESSPSIESDDTITPKSTPKLARQRLVSDGAKQKFIDSKREDRSKSRDKSSDNEQGSLSRRRSGRRERQEAHLAHTSNDGLDEAQQSIEPSHTDSVPTAEEMLLGKPKKTTKTTATQSKGVDHSSPFGSVYSFKSSSQPSKQDDKVDQKEPEETVASAEVKKEKAPSKSSKRMKRYTKAKSLELGVLSREPEQEPMSQPTTQDDMAVGLDESSQNLRKERIAKYKEERRKQLATISSKFDEQTGLPCLFLSGNSTEGSDLGRSKSMKATTDVTPANQSNVSRSKSLKHEKVRDSESLDTLSHEQDISNLRGIRLAERGIQEDEVYGAKNYSFNTDNIIDRLQAIKKLKDEHLKRQGHTIEELRAKRTSKEDSEFDDLSSLDSDASATYSSRRLLADRAPHSDSDSSYRSPRKERHIVSERSSSFERDKKDIHNKPAHFEPLSETAESDISDFEKPERRTPSRRYKPKETIKSSFMEFGTSYTKKESKPVQQPVSSSDKEYDSGRESVDSMRVRRRLPSLEDVLGTSSDDKSTVRGSTPEKTPEPEPVSKREKTPEPSQRHPVKEKTPEAEIKKHLLTREDIAKLSADQIASRKIEMAKSKFKEDVSDNKPFELGTVYGGKSSDDRHKDLKKYHTYVDRRSVIKKEEDDEGDFTVDDFKAAEAKLIEQKKAEELEKQKKKEARMREDGQELEEKQDYLPEVSLPDEEVKAKVASKPPSSPRADRRKYDSKFAQKGGLMEFGTVYSKKEPEITPAYTEATAIYEESGAESDFQKEPTPPVVVEAETKEEAVVHENKPKTKRYKDPSSRYGGQLQFEFGTSYTKKDSHKIEPQQLKIEEAEEEQKVEPEQVKMHEPSKSEIVYVAPPSSEISSDIEKSESTKKKHFEQKEKTESKSFMEFGTSYSSKRDSKKNHIAVQPKESSVEERVEQQSSLVVETLPAKSITEPAIESQPPIKQEQYHSDVSEEHVTRKKRAERINVVKKLGSQFATPDSADRFEFGTSYSKKEGVSQTSVIKEHAEVKQSDQRVTSPTRSQVTGITLTSQTSVEKKEADVTDGRMQDIKAQAVSSAAGQQFESPTSPRRQESPQRHSPKRGRSPQRILSPKRGQSPQRVVKQQMAGVAVAARVPDSKTAHVESLKAVKVEASEIAKVKPVADTAIEATVKPGIVRQTSGTSIELIQPSAEGVAKARTIKQHVEKAEIKEVKVPATAKVHEVKAAAKAEIKEVKVPEKAQVQEVKVPEKAKVREVKVPVKAQVQEVKVPVKAQVQEVKVPVKAQVQEVKVPAKAEIKEVQAPEKVQIKQVKIPEPELVKDVEKHHMVASHKPELFTDVALKHTEHIEAASKPEELPEFLKPDPQPVKKHHEHHHKHVEATTKPKDDAAKSKKEERSKMAEKMKHGKVKVEKTVLMKVRGEKQLMESSLDDILSRNIEYLSDLEVPEFSKPGEKKSRPKSVHANQKAKRFRKKAAMRRSKSEDRSHFQIKDSDEDPEVTRTKIKEDLQKTVIKTLDTRGRRPASRRADNVQQPSPTSQSVPSTQTGSQQIVTQLPTKTENQTVQKTEFQSATQNISQDVPANFVHQLAAQTEPLSQKSSVSVVSAGVVTSELQIGQQPMREQEMVRAGTDSDQSVSSMLSEGSRRRRKDKTSMRKSKLNESSDDSITHLRQTKDSSDESSRGRVSVRRAASSRTVRESREDKFKNGDDPQAVAALKGNGLDPRPFGTRGHSAERPSLNSSLTVHKSTESSQGHKPVLDTVLPSKFALPSKISTAITKLSEASEKANGKDAASSPRGIKRGTNFSQLLQKFSSSEASSSDTDSPRGRKTLLKRQEAYRGSSASSDDATRRTPERTQSLKISGKISTVSDKETTDSSSIQRSASFKSDFMKRRFSPEPSEGRRRLPETPKEAPVVEQSDKPTPELAGVLSKRSEIVAKQQSDNEVKERQKIHDRTVAKADTFTKTTEEEVIADSEVLQMLRSRRKETDSSVESAVSEADKVTEKPVVVKAVESQPNETLVATSKLPQSPSESVTSVSKVSVGAAPASSEVKQPILSQSSFESKTSFTLSSSHKDTSAVPKLDLSSIDTSLSVLESVTDDIGKPSDDSNNEIKLSKELSELDVKSPTQVVQFIKTHEKDKPEVSVESIVSKTQDSKSISENVEQKQTSEAKTEVVSEPMFVPKVEAEVKHEVVPVAMSAQIVNTPPAVTTSTGTIDMTNKSEIMRRFSSREKVTPERQSPQRTGPMKVISQPPQLQPAVVASGSNLKRTESVGRTESERPKGILKRTPSLKQTGVIVDPELASVLRSRRLSNDEDDEEGEKLTAEEEIQKAREEALAKEGAGEDTRQVSVAERIFQMHTKIEEVKSCPITPRAYSGLTTPRSTVQRSGTLTPTLKQFSFDDAENQQANTISGSQLFEKLASLEGQQSSIEEKRGRFQHRTRSDERTRTQPVTLHEIQLADRKEKSLRGEQRNKTVPVTAAELSAVPEGEVSSEMNALKKKYDLVGARDSRADSGILSGSDLEREDAEHDDDRVKMSVSAKASMFLQIQESLKDRDIKKSASGAKRYIDRKKRERSRTLPITEDEVKLAAEFADEENEADRERDLAIPREAGEGDVVDELTSISLKDKVKLFSTIEEEEKKSAALKKGPVPPPKRRGRKLASRFSTQPVTYEEVEKAAKISPLACSLAKPPDPELLSGLSVKAQQELITQHAQQSLSQPGSRSGSRVSSRATSVSDLREQTISTDFQTFINTGINEKLTSFVQTEDSGIRPSHVRTKGVGILKQEEVRTSSKVERFTGSELDSKKKSILKSELESKLSIGLFRPGGGGAPTVTEINRVLKKGASMDSATYESQEVPEQDEETTASETTEVQGFLKKESCTETRQMGSVLSQLTSRVSKVEPDTSETGESDERGLDSSGDNLDSDEGLLDADAGTVEEPTAETSAGRRRSSKNKRRFNRDRQLETERYKTQPADGGDSVEMRQKKKYGSRHFTQPITPDEKKEAEDNTALPEVTKTGSISDRLSALKKSGDEEWKKRVSKPVDLDSLERRSMSPPFTPPMVKMREKKQMDTPRPSSIADRLTALDSAQGGWKDRVGETDVKKFTLEHKLSASGQTVGESPLVARLRHRGPRREGSRDSESSDTSDLTSPSSPSKETKKFSMPKEVICADIPVELLKEEKTQSPLASISAKEEERKPTNVEVPRIGDELELFFKPKESRLDIEPERPEVSVDDFNEIFLNANDVLETHKKIRPKRRHIPKSRNPLKTMSMNLEVKTEYTEVITGVADRELKRVKTAEISSKSGFAVEALAGLASVENFSKVELRKTESDGNGSAMNRALEPFMPVMLIHIKGRRKVQCRLVEPSAVSINSGDCYVVVTNDRLIQWIGDYCNVIEKAKAADFCDFVRQKRDLGCKRAHDITTVEEKKGKLGGGRHFWNLIGGQKPYMACGPQEEDELYETHITETNRIYTLEDNKLVPVEEYWGNVPKYEMLQPDQVFVFDFGSEVYLWQGKTVTPNQRKVSIKLAQQLWNNGYDYSTCDINPICPLKSEEEGGLPTKSDTRPDWALFGKVNQNMETLLFREKFADWPDTSRLIKVKSTEEVSSSKLEPADLKPYDADLMVPINTKPVTLVLEGSNVGRGTRWEQDMDGFIQVQNVETLKVRVWHVLEYDHFEIEPHSYGQFHEGDTYVIRWQYMIINAGMKSLKGQASRHTHMGRERCAYFFWQGKSSTINEKGASALMTVELDEERGPQVRVIEGKEPACFLNLFGGRMIIHIGKREDETTNTEGPWRFYCLRNEYNNEMCLIEVERDVTSLRSVSSHLLLNVETGKLLVWHGCKSPEHVKKLAMMAAENLQEKCPLEVGLQRGVTIDVTELEEGKENLDFWRSMSGRCGDRTPYNCLLHDPESYSHTLRLFHMTSVSGVFEAQEIINPSRSPDLPTRFPCIQTDLYKVSQPGLFLVDNGHEVYLWQGWWPEGDEEQENVLTGSAQTRFTADRKCALETTLQYCKKIRPDHPPSAYLVYAGLEPLSFTNLFPFWTVDDKVREINIKDGKTDGQLERVEDLLRKLKKTRYPLAELLDTPLPEGVDPLKLETYLCDEEFEGVLEMTREEYYALPAWKQSQLKKQVGLY